MERLILQSANFMVKSESCISYISLTNRLGKCKYCFAEAVGMTSKTWNNLDEWTVAINLYFKLRVSSTLNSWVLGAQTDRQTDKNSSIDSGSEPEQEYIYLMRSPKPPSASIICTMLVYPFFNIFNGRKVLKKKQNTPRSNWHCVIMQCR